MILEIYNISKSAGPPGQFKKEKPILSIKFISHFQPCFYCNKPKILSSPKFLFLTFGTKISSPAADFNFLNFALAL